jgi:uncharacterized membrane protein
MKRDTRIVASFLGAIPVVILTVTTACTWMLGHGASRMWRVPFLILCHGLPSRSLTLFGTTMPLCARCVGIYVGLFMGLAAYLVLPRVEERLLRGLMYVMAMPMAVDGITQLLRLRESTNPIRLATGFIAAFAFGMWALSEVEQHEPKPFTTA